MRLIIRRPIESLAGYPHAGQHCALLCGRHGLCCNGKRGTLREWGDYLNEDERDFKDGQTSPPTGKITAGEQQSDRKAVFFDSSDYDGLDANLDYLFGGRSFTVYEADGNGLTEVFDSGSDFEAKTAIYVPENFNCSNDDKSIDDRSGKERDPSPRA